MAREQSKELIRVTLSPIQQEYVHYINCRLWKESTVMTIKRLLVEEYRRLRDLEEAQICTHRKQYVCSE